MTRRRRNGEGLFRRRKDNRYEWRDPRSGKSYYAKTERALTEKMRQVLGTDPSQPSKHKPTVKQLVASWLAHVATRVRPNTHASYSQICATHITAAIGKIRAHKLTPIDVQSMLDSVAAKRSPGTVRHVRTVIRLALAWAVAMELVRRNVAESTQPPKRRRPDVHPLDEAQLAAFLSTIAGNSLEALYLLAVGCGPRMGEILGLRWSDVDFAASTATIRRTLQPCGVLAPKSESSKRVIHLPARVTESLRRHRVRQRETRLAAGEDWTDTDAVFASATGAPLEKRGVDRRYQRILTAAKIGHFRFHDLRHTYATHALNGGVPVKLVSEQLGHASVAFTLSTYAHVLRSQERTSADVMNGLLGG